MNKLHKSSKQHGSALLASLILVVIFTLIGMTAAKKSILAEKISNERENIMSTKEAAEISLAAVANTIDNINGPLSASTNPSVRVLSTATDVEIGQSVAWEPTALADLFNSQMSLPLGLVRTSYIEPDLLIWQQQGIVNAGFTGTIYDVASNRRIQTYTFIESYHFPPGMSGTLDNEKSVYVITVKSAIYAPFTPVGAAPFLPGDEIEQANTILQVVYQKYY